jgi:predicted ATPase
MITIKFLKDHRSFKTGEVIRLDGHTTILVGDQGTGKSTLLELISEALVPDAFNRFSGVAEIAVDEPVTALYHDYEKGNVRGGAAFGMGGIDDMGVEIQMLRASHGQAAAFATRYLFDKLKKETDKSGLPGMLILDEPDASLSVRTAVALGRAIKHIGDMGHYVIASVHSMTVMGIAAKQVYDVELRKYVTPEEFLDRMMTT